MNALITFILYLSTGDCIRTTVITNRLSPAGAALGLGQFDVLRNQIDRALTTTSAPTKSKVVS